MTENDPHPKRASTRTERARSGRWAIGRIGDNRYRVVNLDNGGHTYTVTHADDEWACDCQDYTQRRGTCKHIEAVRLSLEGEHLQVQPLIASDEAGIRATFLDGADLSLTVGGRTACSRCGSSACEHTHAALPHYTRWLWAQAIEGRWPAHRIAQLGVPPAAAQPALVGVEPWRFLEPVVCGGATLHAVSTSWADGCIVRFLDGGHVYVGPLHPDGHTACLGQAPACQSRRCDHISRALRAATPFLNAQSSSETEPAQPHHPQEVKPMSQEQGPNWDEIKRQLAAPFHSYYVGWKAQATSKDKTRALAVPYIDARTVMDRLDQVVGPGNWSDTYRLARPVRAGDGEFAVECTLTLFAVCKSDVGTADEDDDGSQASLSKSAYSDALKRAAVKWGIGRYLYRVSRQWVGYDAARKQLAETPELPAWALPGGNGSTNTARERPNSKDNGRVKGKSAAQPVTAPTHDENSSELEHARATVLPFGTRNHPEYKGKTLGEVSSLNGDLVAWLATEFAPTSDGGRTVQRAAKVVTEHAKAA
jgi:hypothetical protein